MKHDRLEIQSRGKSISVPSACVDDRTIVVTGRTLRIATIVDEELNQQDSIADPEDFASRLKESGIKADVFTFSEKLPDTRPRHAYPLEWDSFAAIPITTYEDWFERRTEYDVRKAIKRARRDGVDVRIAKYDDEFVHGICRIYNETPVRQGKPFWHYGKEFEVVKSENSTYFDRCEYIGAYVGSELIGFIRMIYVRNAALTLQVISLRSQFAKKPVNALIAKAVEVCGTRGLSHFVYGRYVYNGNADSSLTEFKRRNGFQEILVPRYYVPLTAAGRLALALKLHRPLANRIPDGMKTHLRRIRNKWWERRSQVASEA